MKIQELTTFKSAFCLFLQVGDKCLSFSQDLKVNVCFCFKAERNMLCVFMRNDFLCGRSTVNNTESSNALLK